MKFPFIKLFVLFFILSFQSLAQLAPGFSSSLVGFWTYPTAIKCDHLGRLFVAQKDGKLFMSDNGISTLILDLSEEVAFYGDFGLLNFIFDPQFSINGYVYLYYVVDRHHLMNFGTPTYNSATNENGATIIRLTRYTLNKNTNFTTVVSNSRKILVGESKSTGFPVIGTWHGGGVMDFGTDGTLLVGCGDAAFGGDYESQAIDDGIVRADEYDRWWRAQQINSLNGKIIRIDPNTGNGIPSNPYYNAENPRSPQSRVWAMGFRNPYNVPQNLDRQDN